MSDQNVKGKSKYESPILVPLGGMAKGAGVDCVPGGTALGYCTPGTSAQGIGAYCKPGSSAQDYCEAGVTATDSFCSKGTLAGGACTDGVGKV